MSILRKQKGQDTKRLFRSHTDENLYVLPMWSGKFRNQEEEMKGMVDVVVGPMNVEKLVREIRHYLPKSPKRMVIDIRLKKNGYHTSVYIDKKCFDAFC